MSAIEPTEENLRYQLTRDDAQSLTSAASRVRVSKTTGSLASKKALVLQARLEAQFRLTPPEEEHKGEGDFNYEQMVKYKLSFFPWKLVYKWHAEYNKVSCGRETVSAVGIYSILVRVTVF